MGFNNSKVKTKWLVIAALFFFLFAGSLHVLSPFPKKEFHAINLPNSFAVPINTGFEIQEKNQCAAFSTAFILRNHGQKARGSEVYPRMQYKLPISGYVLPKGVVSYIQAQGLRAKPKGEFGR